MIGRCRDAPASLSLSLSLCSLFVFSLSLYFIFFLRLYSSSSLLFLFTLFPSIFLLILSLRLIIHSRPPSLFSRFINSSNSRFSFPTLFHTLFMLISPLNPPPSPSLSISLFPLARDNFFSPIRGS